MATIRKRGNRWQVQVRRQGYRAISRTFQSKNDALTWARQVESEVDRRGLPPDLKLLERTTLGNILERYRDTVVVAKRSRPVETIIIDALLRTDLAALALARLTPGKLAEYRDARLADVKPVTVNRELGLIQHAVEVARREWNVPMPDNPVRQVRRPRLGPPRDRRLNSGELERLVAAFRRCRNRYIAPLVHFAIETGMRQGELLRASWTDIHGRTLRIAMTKNGHPRTIPLSDAAMRLLEALQDAAATNEPRIFPATDRSVKLAWRRAAKRAGIVDLHFHDLRHEAISRFFVKGLNVPEVALISGHRDPRMLFRYTHPRPEAIAAKLQ